MLHGNSLQQLRQCAGDAEGHCRQQAHQQQHQGAAHSCDQPSAWPQAGRCQHCSPHLHRHFGPLLAPPPTRQSQAAITGTARLSKDVALGTMITAQSCGGWKQISLVHEL